MIVTTGSAQLGSEWSKIKELHECTSLRGSAQMSSTEISGVNEEVPKGKRIRYTFYSTWQISHKILSRYYYENFTREVVCGEN